MPKKAINSLFKKKRRKEKVLSMVYIFFPIFTGQQFFHSLVKTTGIPSWPHCFALFFFFGPKKEKITPQTNLCWRAKLLTSHLTWLIFVLLIFLHPSAKGTAPPRLPPPAQPFPVPAPTLQGRAVGTRNWEGPGCTWQCLGAEGGRRTTTPGGDWPWWGHSEQGTGQSQHHAAAWPHTLPLFWFCDK